MVGGGESVLEIAENALGEILRVLCGEKDFVVRRIRMGGRGQVAEDARRYR
jgi:hypothetical protein